MARLSKDARQGKKEWADRRMADNARIETLTKEQHEILEWLCSVRHEMHKNQDEFFNAESSSKFWEMVDSSLDSEEINIDFKLKSSGLEEIGLNVRCINYLNNYDYDEEINEADFKTYEEYDQARIDAYADAFDDVCKMASEVNNQIESYLLKIDKEHGTDYCPAGIQRLM